MSEYLPKDFRLCFLVPVSLSVRLCKPSHPRRTNPTYLQNVFDCYFLPIPTQAPPTPRELISLPQYEVTEEVESEVFVYGSGELTVDESALQWSKMSDDESDSEMEEMFIGGCGFHEWVWFCSRGCGFALISSFFLPRCRRGAVSLSQQRVQCLRPVIR